MSVRIVVVGAGPAGSAAAVAAARRGADVVLVDRARFPRDKACGDGIASAGIDVLRRLGAAATLEQARHVDGARFRHGTHLGIVYEKSRASGVSLPRRDFDNNLVSVAVDCGVSFLQSVRATDVLAADGLARTVMTDAGPLDADVVIVADGATSPLRTRLLGRASPDVSGVAIRTYVAGLDPDGPAYLEFVLPLVHGGRVIPGYGWVFPAKVAGQPEICANVGVGIMTNVHMRLPQPRALLAGLLGRLKGIADFADLREVGPPLSGALRSSEELPEAPYPNVLFVGDSAGLVNPATGEGIAPALESGEIAGTLAAEAADEAAVFALAHRYKELLAVREDHVFDVFRSDFARPAGWQLAGLMMETQRPSFVALRQLWADELGQRHQRMAPDPVGDVVSEALDALPSVVVARTALELWRDRGSLIARLFDALLGADRALTSPDRDVAAVITLMDLHTLFMLDLGPARPDGISLSDGLPLLTADMLLVQAQRLATRTPQARPLLPPFGAAHASLGIQIAVGFGQRSLGDLELCQAALASDLAGRYLASQLDLDAGEEDRLVDTCHHLGLITDLTWRLRHVALWMSLDIPAAELPVWATRTHPDLDSLAADLVERCVGLCRQPLTAPARWPQLSALGSEVRRDAETQVEAGLAEAAR
ncbi:MAG: geranylgeranyl reductase family protein [Acidimicrobiia bacterium]|nr:geranylgeranyl reductase family protein [Acidimicrobiia bacterium]